MPCYMQVCFHPTRGETVHHNLAGRVVRLVEVVGNSSGTRYPPTIDVKFGYASSRDVPYIIDHQTHRSPTTSVMTKGQDAFPLEGFNLGDFEANDSNIGRDGQEVPHH